MFTEGSSTRVQPASLSQTAKFSLAGFTYVVRRGAVGARNLQTFGESACHFSHSPFVGLCMPPVRFKLRGPCSSARAAFNTSLGPRAAIQPVRISRISPRAQALKFHTQILRMDVRDLSETSASSGDDLKLTNRLNESRSPYVSAN